MNIIVKSKESEGARRNREAAQSQRKHYYEREIRDGSRFRSKAGDKATIKRVLDEAASE